MSVINTMLRDLETRRASGAAGRGLLDEVALVPEAALVRRGPSRSVAMISVASGVAVAAVLYAWRHAPIGTLPAHAAFPAASALAPRAPVATVPAVSADTAAPAAVATAAGESTERVASALFRLATSLSSEGVTTTAAASERPAAALAGATSVATTPVASSPREAAVPLRPRPAPAELGSGSAAPDAKEMPEPAVIHVEQSGQTAAERVLAEVQRAIDLQRRGALSEAEASLRALLTNDKGAIPARLALVALLQKQARMDEARVLLREGVSLSPTQASVLLPYARLLAARNEWSAAMDALAPASEALAQDAEYRGLCGVVLQRLGRFPQSVLEYRAALRLSPGVAAWWVGLGLSLEGDGRSGEARAAYLQARSTPLTPELAQFVEAKVRAAASE